ncbi:Nitrilase/cyanide hydratase and apolipoprotein N-acyltransferase [Shewanella denitrificans OS217]|uniref:Nitrilase/cyanide hydratase and apolipoprotein N-acyltransferase n=1 Tax=Shewanella denitrificans (strain OS217 / ATCC BAA-1090 / DSM 15013) TaxID=318161 RepID=Q12IX2_SHEDO|nr:carbon-nitrogen hydrolase family protein [Shewanella denitrificans]ABE56604.1 Nitrilase/cyanide hydratase and apolipoprotein N-acyltransferase [Shewanella denitrificans OS217]
MQISLLQCQSSRDVSANIDFIDGQLALLPREADDAQLVVLPECSLLFGGHESQQLEYAGTDDNSKLKAALADLAKRHNVYLIAGTIPMQAQGAKVHSRCYFFDNQGITLGHYDKLHLFDVDVSDNTKQYRESDSFTPGEGLTVIDTPFGKIGLAICYDLRFADLFRALRLAGADFIALPSAFTKVTGEAHWQTLLQARAIETQCYLLGAGQWGQHNEGSRETWGQSMIVDPWGRIVSQLESGCGWVQAKPDFLLLERIRQQMPVQGHNRFLPPTLIKKP